MTTAKDFAKLRSQLAKMEGAVSGEPVNIHANVIHSPSPSYDFIYGNGWGLPRGYSELLYGPPKGGKSYVVNARIGQFHRDDPEGFVIKYNTEMREKAQMTPAVVQAFGIDPNRYMAFEVNTPDLVYDHFANKISALCEEGWPIRLAIIDSINNIQGWRGMEQEGSAPSGRGDLAYTNQEGLKAILPVQRKYGIALIITAHIRAEQNDLEQKRGNKIRPGVSFGVQHHCEYCVFVEPNRFKTYGAGKDLQGNDLINKNLKDMKGEGEQTAHRVFVQMVDSSLGPKKRIGEFTMAEGAGIINVHEEVFRLGCARGVVEKNGGWFSFGGRKWNGDDAFLDALRADPDLQQAILKELKRRDMEGWYAKADQAAAAAEDAPEA